MGRNFFSVCHECEVQLMHLRGKEGETLHKFADAHYEHRERTEVLDDYIEEPPEQYEDQYDLYHLEAAPTTERGEVGK